MAYANAPQTSSTACWLTDHANVLTFSGDYREHLHLEHPDSPLYKNQLNLPSLPVTNLQTSAAIYLQSVQPLCTPEAYAKTKAAVDEFLQAGGRGQELQRRLEQRAVDYKDSSWLQEWWNKGSYLEYREPNVIFVSYFFHFADLPMGYRNNQITRAAALLHGALTYRQNVVTQNDVGLSHLCATPFKYLFNSCRVPVLGCDKSVVYSPNDSASNQVVVIHKRQFFSFTATHDKSQAWKPKPLSYLMDQLHQIQHFTSSNSSSSSSSSSSNSSPAIGGMCAGHRDAWSKARQQLVNDGNQLFLDAVQSSILIVCLDDGAPNTREEVGRALWHGDSRDRWYDKTIELVVFKNGKAGMMGEHSQFDGQVAVGLADYCLQHERKVIQHVEQWGHTKKKSSSSPPPKCLSSLIKWSFASSWNLKNIMHEFHDLIARHDLSTVTFRLGGKKMIKSFKISPDAFAQMAIQLAYYRMFGTIRATYEPLSMRQYRHGRTETVRVVSNESRAFVEGMGNTTLSSQQRVSLLRTAGNQHVKYIKNAAQGHACDRHLWGLRQCIGTNETMPSMFQDPVYWSTCNWHISTSNLSNDLFDGWGWGEGKFFAIVLLLVFGVCCVCCVCCVCWLFYMAMIDI